MFKLRTIFFSLFGMEVFITFWLFDLHLIIASSMSHLVSWSLLASGNDGFRKLMIFNLLLLPMLLAGYSIVSTHRRLGLLASQKTINQLLLTRLSIPNVVLSNIVIYSLVLHAPLIITTSLFLVFPTGFKDLHFDLVMVYYTSIVILCPCIAQMEYCVSSPEPESWKANIAGLKWIGLGAIYSIYLFRYHLGEDGLRVRMWIIITITWLIGVLLLWRKLRKFYPQAANE